MFTHIESQRVTSNVMLEVAAKYNLKYLNIIFYDNLQIQGMVKFSYIYNYEK